MLTRKQAEEQGYTVDTHVYPHVAYKGERFNNQTYIHVLSEREEALLANIERLAETAAQILELKKALDMKLSQRARTLVDELEAAAIERSWSGAREPAEHEDIDAEYGRARSALSTYILYLERNRA